MSRTTGWLVLIIVAAAVAAVLIIHYMRQQPVEAPPAPPQAAQQPPPPPAKQEPQIKHPIEEAHAGAEAAPQPLPQLGDSDAVARESLEGVLGKKAVADFIDSKDFIRHFVAAVDAMPRDKVPRQIIPLKPVAGRFAVRGEGNNLFIDSSNDRRYAPLVHLAETVDAKKLVSVYVGLYPLFQEAYRRIGYPADYFNDRLIEAIDDLLAAPEPHGPVKLVRPKVLYQFADPDLEERSPGQKMMIRMGLQNEQQIKAKLKEIRKEITGSEVVQ